MATSQSAWFRSAISPSSATLSRRSATSAWRRPTSDQRTGRRHRRPPRWRRHGAIVSLYLTLVSLPDPGHRTVGGGADRGGVLGEHAGGVARRRRGPAVQAAAQLLGAQVHLE